MSRHLVGLLALHVAVVTASAAEKTKPLDPLLRVLERSEEAEVQRDILRGLAEAYRGRRDVPMPAHWNELQPRLWKNADAEVRDLALFLSVLFGDAEAVGVLRSRVADNTLAAPQREKSLQTLVEVKVKDLLPLLAGLLGDAAMRGPALRALAAQKDAAVPVLVLKYYTASSTSEKELAVATLSGRVDFAFALLDAVDKKLLPRADISAYAARQIAALNDKKLTARLNDVWGTLRPTGSDKKVLLSKYLALVPPDAVKKGNRVQGHHLYKKHCAACHKLFGDGGAIGPELTGSQRANPEYVLTKLLDPSAAVPRDYQMTLFNLKDGRLVSGIVKEDTGKTLAVQTQTELVRFSAADVETRKATGLSLMPDGILPTLADAEVRDLIAYLALGPE